MAYSRIVRYGTGSTNTFNVQFTLGYIEEADVKCRVGNEVDGTGNPVYRICSFNTPGFITISGAAPGNGVQVVFERTVDKEHIPVDFSDGSEMDETNLDTLQTVLMMQIHEVLDGRFSTLADDLDMGTFRVVNVGEPVNAQDAATKNYADTKIATGAANAAAAAASATTANTAAANAGTQAGAAAVSATLAEKWASWPVDTEVTTGKYSAYHWAYQAALSAAAAALFDPSNYYTKTQIDASFYTKTAIDSAFLGVALKTRMVTGGGIATGGGDLSADRVITVPKAAGSELRIGTDDAKALTSKAVADAMTSAALPYAATVTLDHRDGTHRSITLTGNVTFAAPTAIIPGMPLNVWFTQDATGSRVVSAWNAAFDFGDASAPVLSIPAGSIDLVSFVANPAGTKFVYIGTRKRAD